jgi:hypothetical protein
MLAENRKIVTMNDLVVGTMPQDFDDPLGWVAGNASQLFGAVI